MDTRGRERCLRHLISNPDFAVPVFPQMSTSTQTQITPFFSPPTILLPSLVITPPRVAFGVSAVHTLWIVLTDIFSLFLNFTPRSWSSARVCDCEASRVLVDKSLNQSDPRHARPINGVNVVTFTHFINVGLFLGLLPYSKATSLVTPQFLSSNPMQCHFRPKRSNKYGRVCGNGWVVRCRVVIIVVNSNNFREFSATIADNYGGARVPLSPLPIGLNTQSAGPSLPSFDSAPTPLHPAPFPEKKTYRCPQCPKKKRIFTAGGLELHLRAKYQFYSMDYESHILCHRRYRNSEAVHKDAPENQFASSSSSESLP
ncbi:hypothetical protein B0H16DRAFT_1705974 [Mycena metata]|uniref:Uncharacterized protein n=1 Tax=Mycena metata TaxID=1033252 RepID=A0AAD7DT94_9AGAR|nr:hypothetical protein B0H16DRAFT_1705974 [Mycena metata]